jgi:EmrB/QacA subfamily drug resistance transporter
MQKKALFPSKSAQHERRWLILGVIALAQLLVVLDVTIVNIALPSAQADLGFSDDSRQWVITAYALAFGSLLLVGGKLSDLLGRKWTFIGGLGGFAAASALGGAAPSFELLIAARALQGAFAALLAPAALSIVTTTFTDPQERGKAFGVYGGVAVSGAAVGLLLGGILTEALSWRWVMYVGLFFAIPAALAALRLLVNTRPATRPRIDVRGAAVASAGLFALVYGFANAEMEGWGAPLTIGLLAFGIAALAGFASLQRRTASPLLPPRVVADRDRGAAFLAVGTASSAIFGVFLFLTYFLQRNLGFSPIESGLAFLPMVVVIMATATTATPRLLPRLGPRPLVPTGMVLAAGALVFLTGIEVDSTYAGSVLPGLLVMGAGFGLIMAPSMATATQGVAPSDAGVASASVSTMQQVGGSIGTAFLSTMFAEAVAGFAAPAGASIEVAQAAAAVHGYTVAFWWAAGAMLAGAIVTALLFRSRAGRASADAPATAAALPGAASRSYPVASR